jgi:hypothetical protein
VFIATLTRQGDREETGKGFPQFKLIASPRDRVFPGSEYHPRTMLSTSFVGNNIVSHIMNIRRKYPKKREFDARSLGKNLI